MTSQPQASLVGSDASSLYLPSAAVWDCLAPRAGVRTFDWIKDEVRMPEPNLGAPFNWIDYPWTEGICDEWDNPRRRKIWMQFAARLGKTLIAQACIICAIATHPGPVLFGTSTAVLAKQTMKKKWLPMLEQCAPTRALLPPPHRRLDIRLDLAYSTFYAAWSGSPTTLADLAIRYSHANEISKWSKDKSEEADPLALFLERGAEIRDRKVFLESTPTITGSCRVNRGLANSTNCRWQVPCPKCGNYQELVMGNGEKGEPGLIWDKSQDGHSEPDEAAMTARYRCAHCKKEIDDDLRRPMVRKGIWVPEGQWLSKRGTLQGSPLRDGPDAGFQLGRLYAPTFTFGDVAREWVESHKDPERRRNFANSWMGLTFTYTRSKFTWEQAADRLCVSEAKLAVVPKDGIFLTCGVDRQVDHLVYMVFAWGQGSAGWCVSYGICNTWTELEKEVLDKEYAHADGGHPLPIKFTLCDSRYDKDDVYTHCRKLNRSGRWVWPSMGSKPNALAGKPYRREDIEEGKSSRKSRRKGYGKAISLIHVNTNYWQRWIQNAIDRTHPGTPGGLAFPAEAKQDQDLWEQMLNETDEVNRDQTGHESTLWVVVHDHIPVDFRDTARYGRTAAEVETRGAWNRLKPRRPHAHTARGAGGEQRAAARRGDPSGALPGHDPMAIIDTRPDGWI